MPAFLTLFIPIGGLYNDDYITFFRLSTFPISPHLAELGPAPLPLYWNQAVVSKSGDFGMIVNEGVELLLKMC